MLAVKSRPKRIRKVRRMVFFFTCKAGRWTGLGTDCLAVNEYGREETLVPGKSGDCALLFRQCRSRRFDGRSAGEDLDFSRSFYREPLPNLGQSNAGDSFASLDKVGGPGKIVIAEFANRRPNDQVAQRFPGRAHSLLGDGEALTDQVKYMSRAAFADPVRAKVHGKHALCAHVAQRSG